MKRSLPLWLAAVVPAALAGHGLVYALAGRSTADGHHAWLAPALECSLALLATLCLLIGGGALIKSGILAQTRIERSCLELWPRLACAQTAVFAFVEHAEGAHVTLLGIAVQIAVALLAAYVLSLFMRLVARCLETADDACAYLARLLGDRAPFVPRSPLTVACALAVRAGTSRFQRPPPFA